MLLTRLGASLACWLYRFLLLTGKPYRVPKGMEWRTNKEVLRLVTGRRRSRDGGRGPRGHGQKSESEEESVLGSSLPRKGAKWLILSYLPRRDAVRVPSAAGVTEGACDRGRGEQRQSRWSASAQAGLALGPRWAPSSGQRELRTVRPLPHRRSPFGTEPVPTLKSPGPPSSALLSVGRFLSEGTSLPGVRLPRDSIPSGAF